MTAEAQGSRKPQSWRLNMPIAGSMRQFIRENSQTQFASLLAAIAEKYLRAYYNEDFYDFDHNGERFALETFARWWGDQPLSIWDIGANDGGWAELAHAQFPQAIIQSFEILGPVADRYEARLSGDWARLHRKGLSDRVGQVEVTWNRECDEASSITIRRTGAPGGNFASVLAPISTVDMEIAAGLPVPDLVKIDTEGHDAAVIRGAKTLLSARRGPSMIQFEYGETWLPGKETLEEVHALLSEAGYRVGRLHPRHVAFSEYAYTDDHFRMGNVIAAKPADLVEALSGIK